MRHRGFNGRVVGFPLIATDGFEYSFGVLVCLLGSACVYGQVLKTRRNDRVVRVERRVTIGSASRLRDALCAVPLMETSPAALSTLSWPHEHRSAA